MQKIKIDELAKKSPMKTHPKIADALLELSYSDRLYFYSYFYQFVSFKETDMISTAAATIVPPSLYVLYNSRFIDSLAIKEVKFILIHELYHFLHNHIHRGRLAARRDLANVAQDMIINSTILRDYDGIAEMPKLKTENATNDKQENQSEPMGVVIDPNYKGEWIFEELYGWLLKKKEEYDELRKRDASSQENNAKISSGGNGKQSEKQEKEPSFASQLGITQRTERILRSMDSNDGQFLDLHVEMPDEQKEETQEIINSVLKACRSRGELPGDIERMLNELNKPRRENNLKFLRRIIANTRGFLKDRSYSRLNRRVVGMKGVKRISQEINCILDTSGSMSDDIDFIINEINRDGFVVNLIQCDTRVQDIKRITKKGELKKLSIKSFGGTALQPAVDYIAKPSNGLSKFPTVILTDGYTDTLDLTALRYPVLILSVGVECPIKAGRNVKQVKIFK
ncbi:MAG: VWA-like domain-containing protein [Chloroherpetonaceae bacterium]|nr:VWA-like domain-containing protein [Chloroherpetonaceae bacterium]MDW8437659.1 VWA-like domain-containing protein [Chloroherpetonaceae bacterium]